MSEKIPSTVETNIETAKEMAYVQENYQRVNLMKESLGLQIDDNPEEVAERLVAEKQDDIRQVRNSGEALPIKQGRHEIAKAVSGRMEDNLRANGVEISEYGKVVGNETQGITTSAAETTSRIIERLSDVVVNQTKAETQNESIDGVSKVAIFNSEGKDDTREDFQVQRLVLEAAGLHPDAVNNAPYTPGETTSGGWNSHEKIIPTELPGVYYKENFYTPPHNQNANPIRIAEFTAIVPSEPLENSELAA